MGHDQTNQSHIGIRGVTWLLAGALALALMFGLVVSRPNGVLADATTNCDQADLQTALNTQSTVNMTPNCTIYLTSGLSVTDNTTVTIEGNGLILSGATEANPTTAGNFKLITAGNGASLTIDHTTLEYGYDGIHGNGANLITLLTSSISHNFETGVYVDGSSGTVTLDTSTVSGSGLDGVQAVTAVVMNSNVIGNNTRRSNAAIETASATITNSTISGNVQDAIDVNVGTLVDDTIVNNAGGGINIETDATVTASLFAGNSQNCASRSSYHDGGYNLSSDGSCAISGGTTKTNVPLTGIGGLNLLPLDNYGGPTETVALGPDSVAIDAIPTSDCATITDPTTGKAITTDQRGISRPQGKACDIGAYEAPSLGLSLSDQIHDGWYTTSQPVSLTYGGLAPTQSVSCGDSPELAGLSVTAMQLGQSGTLKPTISDGAYSLNCGISQGATPLGVSYSGPAQPFDLKIDTTDPKATITSPTDNAVFIVGGNASAVFSCSDPNAPNSSGITAVDGCAGTLDGTAITSGTALDTSAAAIGTHTLEVTATDGAGNTGSQTVSYQVETLAAPTITVNDGTNYTNADYWYNLSNSSSGVSVNVSDSNSLVTSYTCTDNGSALNLTLSNDTPTSGTADLGDGIHHLSCTASASGFTSAATTATVQVDLTRPSITSPIAGKQYILSTSVPLTCADPNGANDATGSGIASCQVTVTLPDKSTETVTMPDSLPTSEIGSYTVKTKNVADVAGNTTTTSFSYTVGYQLATMPGNTSVVNHGYFAMIRIAPEDVNGIDEDGRSMQVTAIELDGPRGQIIPFVHQFQFIVAHNTPQYQLELNTRNLEPGEWTLKLTIGSDIAITYSVNFEIE